MIWESVPLMTLIDLAILVIAGSAMWVVWRARGELAAAGALRAAGALLFGLGVIGAFYLLDLLTMHVLPRLTSGPEAMAAMESLHLDWTWVVSLVAVGSIFVGFVGIVRSEVDLAGRLDVASAELRKSTAERESIAATLATLEDHLRQALRAARMGTWAYDPVRDAIEWSEGVAELFGLPPGQVARTYADYAALIHPDDRDFVERLVRRTLDEGGVYAVEHRTVTPGGEVRWVSAQGHVYLDEHGGPAMMTGVVWDVTERRLALEAKEASERAQAELNRRLMRQQRLESLGTLSGGIAHDFNNLLTPILGHVEILKEQAEGAAERERLEQIRIAAERARGLVRQILAFSGNLEPAGGAVDAVSVVGEALELVRATLPATVEIRRTMPERSCWVGADPTQLTQVVVNLCTNAAHAMPDGGVLEVGVARVEVGFDAPEEVAPRGTRPGPYVRITVADDGRGMSEAVAERAFEPFFTTKDVGEGTGLGLSQVLGIVRSYGGTVSLDSKAGLGTTVRAFLPEEEPPTPLGEDAHDAAPEPGCRVLLVDDQPAVASMLQTMLRALGHKVVTEEDPAVALDRFLASPDAFDLLVTDQTMPGMTGTVLAERIRNERPGFPTILTSGFTDPEQARQSDVVFLMKPFTRAQLAGAVSEAISDARR